MKRNVVVIGGGIAGLNAGIELLQKGHKVTLIEKNNTVGGLFSGYEVNGFYIDACIHWLMGTKKGTALYGLWENIDGLNDDVEIIGLDSFVTVDYQGTKVRLGRDIEKTRKEWLAISPEDEEEINRFFDVTLAVGTVMEGFLNSDFKRRPSEFYELAKKSPAIIESMNMSREEYAERFDHPALRFAITNFMTGYNNAFFLFDAYSLFIDGNADVPKGGAGYLIERVKNKFLSLGGTLLLNEEVTELGLKNGKVKTVKTSKDRALRPHSVVCTVDPAYAIEHWLGEEYRIPRIEKARKRINRNPTISSFNIYLAIDGDLSFLEGPTLIDIPPVLVGRSAVNYLLIRPYGFDPDHFVRNGKTVVSLFVDQDHRDYQYYKSLSKERLAQVEQRIQEDLLNALLNRYPQLKDRIQVLTLFGPIEIEERFHTSFGAFQSYSFTDLKSFYRAEGKIKGIKNLFFCGQWTRSVGGSPTALITSHKIVSKIHSLPFRIRK